MLHPGPGHSPELVARNQRERLLAATVVAIAANGYEKTPVAELLKLSGISRTTFYQHFPGGKEECFLAAVDAAAATADEAVERACAASQRWEDGIADGLGALAQEVIDQPAAARLCLIDVYSAGAEGLAHAEQATAQFGRLLSEALGRSPEHAATPPAIVSGLVAGIRKVLETRVAAGDLDELPGLMPGLADWVVSYRNPPVPVRRPRTRPPVEGATRFVVHDQVERIFGAIADTVVEKGYPAMTLDDIVKGASASLTTFYQHFDGKEEAFLAAYDTATAQATAAAMPPFRWSRSWPLAVRAALEAYLSFLAAEPAWARIATIDILAAGPAGFEHRDRSLELFDEILEPGLQQAGDAAPLMVEAIGGAVQGLVREQIRRRGAEHLLQILPVATFVALSPFVGPEEAIAVANRGALRTRGSAQGRMGGEAPARRAPRRRGGHTG